MYLKYLFAYRLTFAACLSNWMLFVAQFLCPTATCPPPDFPEGGSYTPKEAKYEVGQSIAYTCKNKWILIGKETITCQTTGTWSDRMPFCGIPIEAKNVTPSSGVYDVESDVIPYKCFRTKNSIEGILTVFLDRPAIVYCIKIYFPEGRGTFAVYLSSNKNTPAPERKLCSSSTIDFGLNTWVNFLCEDNEMTVEIITIKVFTASLTSIWLCDFKIFVKDGQFCANPPEYSVVNGQLEVNRSKATLICNEGFQEKHHRRVYATCKSSSWSYVPLKCIEVICDPVFGSSNSSEEKWHIGGSGDIVGTVRTLKCRTGYYLEGEPLTVTCQKNGMWTKTTAICKKQTDLNAYKIVAIAVGSVLILFKIILMCLAIYLKQRKKAREVVLVFKADGTDAPAARPSVSGKSPKECKKKTENCVKSSSKL